MLQRLEQHAGSLRARYNVSVTVLNNAAPLASRPPDQSIVTRVIQEVKEWHAIRREWDELYSSSPTASPALDFTWLQTWWHVYESGLRVPELRVVTVWRGTRLIGAMPLYTYQDTTEPFRLRRLGFLSTGEAEAEETCADYLNILVAATEEAACVDAVWRAVGLMKWDHLQLLDIPEDTPLLKLGSVPPGARVITRGKCPIADLRGGFDAYLDKLSPSRRQHNRRLIRAGERAGANFEIADSSTSDEAFDDLVRLHQERWNADGKPGVFAAPRFLEFHRSLVRQWLPTGKALLARLTLDSTTAVVLYGFVTGEKFDFYQSGVQVDSTSPVKSPGTLAHLLFMRSLAERGITSYDFLRGTSTYKERGATEVAELIEIQIWRLNTRAVLYRAIRALWRACRKLTRPLQAR